VNSAWSRQIRYLGGIQSRRRTQLRSTKRHGCPLLCTLCCEGPVEISLRETGKNIKDRWHFQVGVVVHKPKDIKEQATRFDILEHVIGIDGDHISLGSRERMSRSC
jgi:hypothetical protein